ncbi:hypothetical protein NU195Hw_g2137t1 [Hortaea werneckii]
MDNSPLLRLSPELRNAIYEHLFDDAYAITLQDGKTQQALTKTCRKLREECLGMYYSLVRLNAHLDDGPATPLARWMETIGRENCLLLNEVNIWDLHMLNATLHGEEATQRFLASRRRNGEVLVLRPAGPWLVDRGWYLKDLVMGLQTLGLSLRMFCEISEDEALPKLSSYFAIVPLDRAATTPQAHLMQQLEELGFDDEMRDDVMQQIRRPVEGVGGYQEVRLRKGRRDFFLVLKGAELVSIRQTFIPREEDWLF